MIRGLGYLFVILGFLTLASGIGPVNEMAVGYLLFLEGIQILYLIIAGIIAIIIGILLLNSSSMRGHHAGEIPIYRGNQIIGYRRR